MNDVKNEQPPKSNRRRAVGAVVIAMVVHLATQAGMYLATAGWSLARFRGFYEHDQLGYLAITKNFSEGQFDSFEPDTETGSNTYPRLYYETLGVIARVFRVDPIVAWNVVGMLMQLVLVAVIAVLLISFSRRWWLGMFAPLPFLLGTFAFLWSGSWYIGLKSHAVIWGPFGVLHSLNGESVSLTIACLTIFGLGFLWLRPQRRGVRLVGTTLLSIVIGGLANVQTYSFIAVVYFLAFVLAVWTLARGRHWLLSLISLALVPVVFVAGPLVAEAGGQLPALVFGMLPAVPGVLALIIETRGVVAIYCVGVVLGAAPQVVGTITGLVTEDPFLVYRVASNSELGIPVGIGLISGLTLIVPLLGIIVAAVVRRQALWAAYAVGGIMAWLMLATNDQWGANAEPYRLWMDVFFILAATLLPVAVVVVRDLWASTAQHVRSADALSTGVMVGPLAGLGGRRVPRRIIASVVVASLAVAMLSLVDWWRFSQSDIARALLVTDSPRDRVLTDLALISAEEHPEELIMVDSCIDPRVLKVTSGVPIAYYHLGMAWPTQYDAIGTIISDRLGGMLNAEAGNRAGATQVLTDSVCSDAWGTRFADDLTEQHSEIYTNDDGSTGTITLWGLN